MGRYDWSVQQEELSQRDTMQKGVFARRNMQQGRVIKLDDVKFLRPRGKITPKEFSLRYRDTPLRCSLRAGEALEPRHFGEAESGG